MLCNTKRQYISALNRVFENREKNPFIQRYIVLKEFSGKLIGNENEFRMLINKKPSLETEIISISCENTMDRILLKNNCITTIIIKEDLFLLLSNFFKKAWK